MKHSDMTPAQKRAAVTFDLKAARAKNKADRLVKRKERLTKRANKLDSRLSKVKGKISNSTKKPLITSKALSLSKVNPLTKKIQKNIITNNKLKRIKNSAAEYGKKNKPKTYKKIVGSGKGFRVVTTTKKPTKPKGKITYPNLGGLGNIATPIPKKKNKVSLGSKSSQSSQAGWGSSGMHRLFKNTIFNPDYRKRNNYKNKW